MKVLKKILFLVLCIISVVATAYFIYKSMFYYVIILATISAILIISFCIYLFSNRNSKASYNSLINNIIHTYDSALVECSELPSLKDKNIILVGNIDDLIDAQIEMRKSIYYKRYEDNTVFILIDNDEACINIVKENPNVKASFEDDIVSYMEKNKGNYINGAILEALDSTTIIKLNNLKEYKVSPVRSKDEKKSDKEDVPKRDDSELEVINVSDDSDIQDVNVDKEFDDNVSKEEDQFDVHDFSVEENSASENLDDVEEKSVSKNVEEVDEEFLEDIVEDNKVDKDEEIEIL